MYVSESFHQRIKKSTLAPGDVVIVRTGKPGTAAVIPDTLPIANCSDLVIVRPGPQLDSKFLAYYINSAAQHHVYAHTVGAVQQHFNVGSAKTIKLLKPSLEEQRAIARILGALDDKIELNRRMNRTLETIVQALFWSWFVDFEPVCAKRDGRKPVGMDDTTAALFPEHFQETDMGPIPLGWHYGTLADLARITSGKRPGQRSATMTSEMGIPIFGGGGVMGYTDQALCTNKMLLTGRVGTLGLIFRITEPCWPSDNTLLLTCADRDHEYVYHLIQDVDFDSLNRGSTQPLVTQGDLLALKVLLPSSEILEKYHAISVNMFNKIDRNKKSIDTLATLRDTLLPQLLSGELRVGQAEEMIP